MPDSNEWAKLISRMLDRTNYRLALIFVGVVIFAAIGCGGIYFNDRVQAVTNHQLATQLLIGFFLAFSVFLFLVLLYEAHRKPTNNTPVAHAPDNPNQLSDKCKPMRYSAQIREVKNPSLYFPVEPYLYSRIAQCYIQHDDVIKIFTVANYEPRYFLEQVIGKCKESYANTFSDLPTTLNIAAVQKLLQQSNTHDVMCQVADELYPHFKAISDKAKLNNTTVIRILLVDNLNITKKEWIDRNYPAIQFFLMLNGEAQLYLVEKSKLLQDGIKMLTDHVIFDDKVCLDYYEDSHHLTVICDGVEQPDEGAASMIFKDFFNHYTTNPGRYFSAKQYFEQAVPKPA